MARKTIDMESSRLRIPLVHSLIVPAIAFKWPPMSYSTASRGCRAGASSSLRLLATLTIASSLRAEFTRVEFVPRDTDPAISASCNSPQCIYVVRGILVDHDPHLPPDRNQLLVFLPGTGGAGGGARAFCGLAAELGYHVINLTYPTEKPASVCRSDSDLKAFENFRMALIQGGQSEHISVTRADTIENRLGKFLVLLARLRPRENWQQFMNADGGINWQLVAVAGQSQGGGHAILIGIKHRVGRVIATGAPKDYSRRFDAPAAWYREESATPKARFFTFNHVQDPQACTPAELLENVFALGLDAFGKPVDVAMASFPFDHTRILLTSFPHLSGSVEAGSKAALAAHGSVISDANAARWKQVWTYMLTEPVE